MTAPEIVERALGLRSLDGMTVICQESSQTNLRWAANTLTTNGVMRGCDVTVIAMQDRADGRSVGVASASVAELDDVTDIVKRAEQAARSADNAPDGAELITGNADSSFGDAPDETSPVVFEDFAPALGRWFADAKRDNIELFGFAEHSVTTTYLGNSAGLRRRYVQPAGRIEVTGKCDSRTRSTWIGRATRDFRDVVVPDLAEDVRTRLGWAAKTVSLDPGRYTVILPPTAVADLLVYQYGSSSARDAAEGRTVFSKPGGGTRLGERLSDAELTLFSDPSYPGMQCLPFVVSHASDSSESVFDNGMELSRTNWIDKGTLASLAQTRYSAALTGGGLTPLTDNLGLELSNGGGSLHDVIARTERGLLLTTLWYIREVDPQTLLLTGLTRDGVYLVENGAVTAAVNNFRFNESPVDLLSRVVDAGAPEVSLPREWSDFFTRVAMPPLVVRDFNMSTVSQAS